MLDLVDEDELVRRLQDMRYQFSTDKEMAEHLGISSQYLHDVVNRRREIGMKFARALGYEPIRMYRKIGGGSPWMK